MRVAGVGQVSIVSLVVGLIMSVVSPTDMWWCYVDHAQPTDWICYLGDSAPSAQRPVFIGSENNIQGALDEWSKR